MPFGHRPLVGVETKSKEEAFGRRPPPLLIAHISIKVPTSQPPLPPVTFREGEGGEATCGWKCGGAGGAGEEAIGQVP